MVGVGRCRPERLSAVGELLKGGFHFQREIERTARAARLLGVVRDRELNDVIDSRDQSIDPAILKPCLEVYSKGSGRGQRQASDVETQPFIARGTCLVQAGANSADEFRQQPGTALLLPRFEVDGVAQEVELDTVEVVVLAGLRDQRYAEIAHRGMRVVESDVAQTSQLRVITYQVFRMLALEPGDVSPDVCLVERTRFEHRKPHRNIRTHDSGGVSLHWPTVVQVVHTETQEYVQTMPVTMFDHHLRRIVSLLNHGAHAVRVQVPDLRLKWRG